jgi:hypothetical protein
MSFQVSLYDALVSIAVPADKARAVADAMERDMGLTLATKSDIELLRQEVGQVKQKVSLELGQLKHEFSLEFNLVRKEMELLRSSMTVRLGSIQVVAAGLLFAALKLA